MKDSQKLLNKVASKNKGLANKEYKKILKQVEEALLEGLKGITIGREPSLEVVKKLKDEGFTVRIRRGDSSFAETDILIS